MLLVDTYVAPSAIEGVGVFAAEPITAGKRIWRLNPRFDLLFSDREIAGLEPQLQQFMQRYAYELKNDPGTTVLECDNGRFMNHWDSPNTRFSDPDAGYALYDIARGEELTCDYSEFTAECEMLPGRFFAVAAE